MLYEKMSLERTYTVQNRCISMTKSYPIVCRNILVQFASINVDMAFSLRELIQNTIRYESMPRQGVLNAIRASLGRLLYVRTYAGRKPSHALNLFQPSSFEASEVPKKAIISSCILMFPLARARVAKSSPKILGPSLQLNPTVGSRPPHRKLCVGFLARGNGGIESPSFKYRTVPHPVHSLFCENCIGANG